MQSLKKVLLLFFSDMREDVMTDIQKLGFPSLMDVVNSYPVFFLSCSDRRSQYFLELGSGQRVDQDFLYNNITIEDSFDALLEEKRIRSVKISLSSDVPYFYYFLKGKKDGGSNFETSIHVPIDDADAGRELERLLDETLVAVRDPKIQCVVSGYFPGERWKLLEEKDRKAALGYYDKNLSRMIGMLTREEGGAIIVIEPTEESKSLKIALVHPELEGLRSSMDFEVMKGDFRVNRLHGDIVDFLPTLLAFLGCTPRSAMKGRNLCSVIPGLKLLGRAE